MPQGTGKKKKKVSRGLAYRRAQAQPGATMTGATSQDARVARSALERQERIARDEPAVPGGDRPSVLRARAQVREIVQKAPRRPANFETARRMKKYRNDAAHGDEIRFTPSEKMQRQRKIGY